MKPNRTFWLLYSAGALLVFIALIWVSVMVLRLESQAQHEQLVRLALWRMDGWLGKRLQTENSRQYFEYQPFYPQRRAYNNLLGEIAPGEVIVPSPLLTFQSEFFPLHFQLDDQHRLTSPQTPEGNWRDVAESAYLPVGEIEKRQPLLDRVRHVMLPQTETFVGCVMQAESQLNDVMREVELPSLANSGVPFPNGFPAPQVALAPEGQGVQGAQAPQRSQKGLSKADLQARTANTNYSPQWESQQEQQRGEQSQQFQTIDTPQQVANGLDDLLDSQSKTQAGIDANAPAGADMKQAAVSTDADTSDVTASSPPAPPAVEVGLLVALWMNSGSQAAIPVGLTEDSVAIRPASLTNASTPAPRELLFVRRVRVQNESGIEQTLYQGALGDWPALRAAMLGQITDLLPEANLEPVSPTATVEADDSDMLAGVPARIVAPCPLLTEGPLFTPARTTLLLTWLAVAGAVAAAGLALRSSIAFGLKRSRFASAVTHELRTPLTTFRMYSEMLAEGMVRDESQRKTYLDTLKTESNRLATLVENVLSYARLEDGRAIAHARQSLSVPQLLDRITPMLQRRASEAGMTLNIVNVAPDSEAVSTDVEAVGQILFNLVDNACKYARDTDDRSIDINARLAGPHLEFTVRDHGPGIRPEHARIIFAPFERGAHGPGDTIPGVGLGLALCRGLARDLGGDLTLEKTNGTSGTSNGACFKLTVARGA